MRTISDQSLFAGWSTPETASLHELNALIPLPHSPHYKAHLECRDSTYPFTPTIEVPGFFPPSFSENARLVPGKKDYWLQVWPAKASANTRRLTRLRRPVPSMSDPPEPWRVGILRASFVNKDLLVAVTPSVD